jgi:hypothetical protein
MPLVDLKAYSLAKLAIDKKFYRKLSSLERVEVHAPQYPCTLSAIDGRERAKPDIQTGMEDKNWIPGGDWFLEKQTGLSSLVWAGL